MRKHNHIEQKVVPEHDKYQYQHLVVYDLFDQAESILRSRAEWFRSERKVRKSVKFFEIDNKRRDVAVSASFIVRVGDTGHEYETRVFFSWFPDNKIEKIVDELNSFLKEEKKVSKIVNKY